MEPLNLIEATLAVATGAIVQATSGVGGGFVVVPLLAMVDTSLIPGPLVFASLALSGVMTWAERRHVDLANLPAIFAGIVPGCAAGAWAVSQVPPERLGLLFGGLVLVGVLVTAARLSIPVTRGAAFLTGAVSGAMGTTAGFGAPALALLYQDQSGPRVRATLAVIYSLASVAILLALAAFGRFDVQGMAAGALLIPGNLLGWLVARRLVGRFDQRRSRRAVLMVSALAAASLLGRSL